jgi:hypothetical protein
MMEQSNEDEVIIGTDPEVADTDGDGVNDSITTARPNWKHKIRTMMELVTTLDLDDDNDGISDIDEISGIGTRIQKEEIPMRMESSTRSTSSPTNAFEIVDNGW